jgi:hypothetical protein
MATERGWPEPECPADEMILLLLGERAHFYRSTTGRYDWRAAQLASWPVPVACCVRCRGEEVGCGGLQCRHTIHSQCFPEAWDGPNVWPPKPCRCDHSVAWLEGA